MDFAVVDNAMRRAVHGLQKYLLRITAGRRDHFLVVRVDPKHVVSVVIVVSARLPQIRLKHQRRRDLLVVC